MEWTTPNGEWLKFQILRNSFGLPVNATDGTVVFEGSTTDYSLRVVDQGLPEGRFFYYSMFVFGAEDRKETISTNVDVNAATLPERSSGDIVLLTGQTVPSQNGYWYYRGPGEAMTTAGRWVRVGDTLGLTTINHRNSERLFSRLPSIYQDSDARVTPLNRLGNESPLERFLRVFGYHVDHLQTEYDSLLDVADPERIAGGLLPLLGGQYEVENEPTLGMKRQRAILNDIVYLYHLKGTSLGLEGLVRAYTGWDADVRDTRNLLLSAQDSNFSGGLGSWVAGANTTAERVVLSNPLFNDAAMLLRASAAGTLSADLLGTLEPRFHALRAVPGRTYTASFHTQAVADAREARVDIQWRDESGVIATTAGTPVTSNTQTLVRPFTTAIAPPEAKYANLVLVIADVADQEEHYIAGVQFEEGPLGTFVTARKVPIFVTADRVNLAQNPSFEVDVTGWSAPQGTITRVTTASMVGMASARMQRTSATTTEPVVAAQTDLWDGIVPGDVAASAHVWPATTARKVRLRLQWFDREDVFIAEAVGLWVDQVLNDFVRPSLVTPAPEGVWKVRLHLDVWGSALDEVHFIDGVLIERVGRVESYFDASTFENEDYLWEDAQGNSRSHYYERRTVKNSRLVQIVPDFLPFMTEFQVIYATRSTT